MTGFEVGISVQKRLTEPQALPQHKQSPPSLPNYLITYFKLLLHFNFSGQDHSSREAASQGFSERLGYLFSPTAERTSKDEAVHVLSLRTNPNLQRDSWKENAIHESSLRLQGTLLGKDTSGPLMTT